MRFPPPVFPSLGLLLFGGILFARNSAGWTDPLVDFGRELYVPWQLAEGHVLYRDIAYLDGPFSPYWNALCFSLFPVSLRTLEFANLAVIALTAVAAFALLRRLAPPERGDIATAGAAVFLAIFAFNLIGTGANMNWVTPYSHGITHGVALSLLSLWLFVRHLASGRLADLGAAGLALGLVALTKPEISAAAFAAIATGFVASLRRPPQDAPSATRRSAVLVAAVLVPGVVATLLLARAMSVAEALGGTLGGWKHLLGSGVQDLHFYRWVMGLDTPAANLVHMLTSALPWGACLVPALVASFVAGQRTRLASGLALALPLTVLLLAPWAATRSGAGDAFRPLSLFLALQVVCTGIAVSRAARGPLSARTIGQLSLAVFSLALLLKVLLKPVLVGYAFALALPGVLSLVLVLLHTIPAAIERRGGDGRIFARTSLAWLAVVAIGCLLLSETIRAGKTVGIGEDSDHFRADPARRARIAANLTRWVDAKLPADASLLVLPEGVIINYLTRRINPTRHLNFLPPELAIFGEKTILEELRSHPPDFVALVQRDTPEYGLELFGSDYGQDLLGWVRESYERVALAGAEPLLRKRLLDRREGFEVLGRRGTGLRINSSSTTP